MIMDKITVSTKSRKEFVEITGQVQDAVRKSKAESGVCFIYVPHTTCGLTINENADISVKEDILRKLRELVPENDRYTHLEGNSDAHILSGILGHSLTVFVEEGSLALGIWQGIFLCEFDGPRTRQVWVKVQKD